MICFFRNVELHSTNRHRDFETNENNLDESDDNEQLAENSAIKILAVHFLLKEQKTQSTLKENTWVCVRM